MTESNRDSLNDVDAGWDDVSVEAPPAQRVSAPVSVAPIASGPVSIAPRSYAPAAELEALDDGWSDVTHAKVEEHPAPASFNRAVVASAIAEPASAFDALDEGWGDDDDQTDASPDTASAMGRVANEQAEHPERLGKKARRKLERDLMVQRAKTKQIRQSLRKETKRETSKRRRDEAAEAAETLRKEQEARKAEKRNAPKQREPAREKAPKQRVQSQPSAYAASVSVAKETTGERLAPPTVSTEPKALLQGWMLWSILVAILVALAYFVSRR